jgi:methionyl-tRNA synthetase
VVAGDKRFYITTPIYYVNDSPHIGHAYTTIACDAMARFKRLEGDDVKFLTGTDEHGQKVDKAAKAAGKDPLAFCNEVSQRFRALVKGGQNILSVTNDDFIRTTEERHKIACQDLWMRLKEKGFIYLDQYNGWYSVRDEAYYTEAELIEKDGKKVAPTGAEVEWVREESYFFQLSAFAGDLLKFYDENPDFITPAHRLNEVKQFVKGGLQDLSISRTKFDWGVPVPERKGHVMYVWIDALTNYLTAVGYPNFDKGPYKEYWAPADEAEQRETHPKYVRGRAVHVIGKDILRFHAVYWPAFLMAAELPLPKQIVAHGWWTIEGEKMSKSLGNVLSPSEMTAKAGGIDQLRYFMLAAMPFGNDGDFAQSRMVDMVNADLANNIGNLAQRTLSMIQKNCEGKVPGNKAKDKGDDVLAAAGYFTNYRAHMEAFEYQLATRAVVNYANNANLYIDEMAPWKLKKENPERMEAVLYALAEAIRAIAILLQPFCPGAAEKMLDQLMVPKTERGFEHLAPLYALKPGTLLPPPQGVFPRLETDNKGAKAS